MKKHNICNDCFRLLSILGTLVLFGCVSLPEKEKTWPWEYGTGQGEPNTGDYVAFRAGVANFGEPPKAVKPLTPESVESPPRNVWPAETKTEPSTVSEQRNEKPTSNKKNGYDFTLSEKNSVATKLPQNLDGSEHDIIAANNGDAPVSVAVTINKGSAQYVSTDKTLPHYVIVPAHSVRTLVHFSINARELASGIGYKSVWSIGDYTATHNCPEQYQFPFGEKVRAFASITNAADVTPFTRNAVIFSMPKETPVLAARKGVVVQIGSGGKIDILHEDSTLGTYYHLERINEYVAVGKTVTTDSVIGIAGTSESNKDAFMQLTVWRPEQISNDQLLTSSQRIGFEAVSYPLAFKSAGSDKGKVLTKNQPVSRGKLQATNKKTKRK